MRRQNTFEGENWILCWTLSQQEISISSTTDLFTQGPIQDLRVHAPDLGIQITNLKKLKRVTLEVKALRFKTF